MFRSYRWTRTTQSPHHRYSITLSKTPTPKTATFNPNCGNEIITAQKLLTHPNSIAGPLEKPAYTISDEFRVPFTAQQPACQTPHLHD